jgi:type IV secretion system protein VirD4
MSRDIEIRKPFFQREMMVFAGSVLSMGMFFVIANRRARKLMENSEDLHRSARWAVEKDIRQTGLLEAKSGVYAGGWSGTAGAGGHYLRHDGPEHILAFAPTRSGKGVGLVIPTLLAWEESAVVYDIKGENWAKTAACNP